MVDEYKTPGLIGNARIDTAIYDLPPASSGKRGRPMKRGGRLSVMEDFCVSKEKIGGYYIGVSTVLTNLFGDRKVLAYVTFAEKKQPNQTFVFQYGIAKESPDFLCVAGERLPEPDRQQLDAIYSAVPILVQVVDRS